MGANTTKTTTKGNSTTLHGDPKPGPQPKRAFTSFKCSCDTGILSIYNRASLLSHIKICSKFQSKYNDVLQLLYQLLETNFLDQSISDVQLFQSLQKTAQTYQIPLNFNSKPLIRVQILSIIFLNQLLRISSASNVHQILFPQSPPQDPNPMIPIYCKFVSEIYAEFPAKFYREEMAFIDIQKIINKEELEENRELLPFILKFIIDDFLRLERSRLERVGSVEAFLGDRISGIRWGPEDGGNRFLRWKSVLKTYKHFFWGTNGAVFGKVSYLFDKYEYVKSACLNGDEYDRYLADCNDIVLLVKPLLDLLVEVTGIEPRTKSFAVKKFDSEVFLNHIKAKYEEESQVVDNGPVV
jgi:ubiquitin-activating enzyme E1